MIPKFQLQIPVLWKVQCKIKCTRYWYANFNFLMYLHNSLMPSVTYILPQERNKKQTSDETSQNCLTGQGQLVLSGNTYGKMGTTCFNGTL